MKNKKDIESAKKEPIDFTRINDIMRKSEEAMAKTYAEGGKAGEYMIDSMRRELINDSLSIAKTLLAVIKTKKNCMTNTELVRSYQALISATKILQETSNNESEVQDMTDEELELLAKESEKKAN